MLASISLFTRSAVPVAVRGGLVWRGFTRAFSHAAPAAPVDTTKPKLKPQNRIFTNLHGEQPVNLEAAMKRGDFQGTPAVMAKGSQWIIDEVKLGNIRGRGGAGFSAGLKFQFMLNNKKPNVPSYLCINADEGEPGTCKDREIMKHEPFKLLEGILLSSVGMKINTAYVYIRGEFKDEAAALQKAIDEAYAANLLGKNVMGTGYDLDVHIHMGAGAYVCGEASALLESIEGRSGKPRIKPPRLAEKGLYQKPTCVSNVETIASVPAILKKGGKWYSSLGRNRENAGTKLFAISGCVNKPCVVEEEMSIPLKQLIEVHAGGVKGGWDNLQCVIPGGASTPLLPKDICDTVLMEYDSIKNAGSEFGSGAVMVFDRSVDMVAQIARLSRFYAHESCGQCAPCREGTGWISQIMDRLVTGDAEIAEIDRLRDICKFIMDANTICPLGPAAAAPVLGLIKYYRRDMEVRIKERIARQL